MSIARIKFTKTTSLSKYLMAMSIGEEALIPYKFYTELQIRRCCTAQNNKGYRFESTNKNSLDGIKVKRLA